MPGLVYTPYAYNPQLRIRMQHQDNRPLTETDTVDYSCRILLQKNSLPKFTCSLLQRISALYILLINHAPRVNCYIRFLALLIHFIFYVLCYVLWLQFWWTTPGMPVGQCRGTSDPSSLYSLSKISRILGFGRSSLFAVIGGVMTRMGSLLCCSISDIGGMDPTAGA